MMFRITSFLVWAVVAAATVFWTLRLGTTSKAAPTYAAVDQGFSAAGGDFSKLLGTTPAPSIEPETVEVESSSQAHRFQLTGVVAPRSASTTHGLALIAVDGQPPKHFRVGSPIDGDLILQSVSRRSASIGPLQGSPVAVLELAPPPEPATGELMPSPMQ